MTLSSLLHEWKTHDQLLTKPYPQPLGSDGGDEGASPSITAIRLKKREGQVETSVAHAVRQKSGGLKPKSGKEQTSHTLGVRFRSGELDTIRNKAKEAGCTTNSYIRASALGSDYKAPMNAALRETLLKLNQELTAHGRNLNQIAKHLNSGTISPVQGLANLGAIRSPLVQALRSVKLALSQGLPQP